MLWYNIYNRTDLSPGSQNLNVGVNTFQTSTVSHGRMSFYISFCNNAWEPQLINRAQWTGECSPNLLFLSLDLYHKIFLYSQSYIYN